MRQCARARGGGREGSDWNVTTKDGWGMGGGEVPAPLYFNFHGLPQFLCVERERESNHRSCSCAFC